MGNLFTWVFLIGLYSLIMYNVYYEATNQTTWQVKITFCDTRLPVVIEVTQYSQPNNGEIVTKREAVPIYSGYLNVCDVHTIGKLSK